jgi:hypothetical protein
VENDVLQEIPAQSDSFKASDSEGNKTGENMMYSLQTKIDMWAWKRIFLMSMAFLLCHLCILVV